MNNKRWSSSLTKTTSRHSNNYARNVDLRKVTLSSHYTKALSPLVTAHMLKVGLNRKLSEKILLNKQLIFFSMSLRRSTSFSKATNGNHISVPLNELRGAICGKSQFKLKKVSNLIKVRKKYSYSIALNNWLPVICKLRAKAWCLSSLFSEQDSFQFS